MKKLILSMIVMFALVATSCNKPVENVETTDAVELTETTDVVETVDTVVNETVSE